MSSRISLDTTSLTIRDVFCLNKNADVIQPVSIPVAGANGKLQWLSSLEFLSTISIPTTSTSLLNYITTLGEQVGSNANTAATSLNTLSTNVGSNIVTLGSNITTVGTIFSISTPIFINSTITGLGSIPDGHNYLSSSALTYQFQNLAANYGYVSTVNPGAYRIYKSSLRLEGSNASTIMATGENISSAVFSLQGFASKAVSSSHMRIDINANIGLVYASQLASLTTLSTILYNPSSSQIVGDPVSLTFNSSNATIGNLSFLLNASQLSPFPSTLQICHVLRTGNNLNLTTNIPQIGGIFVTLDNTD
jgi:hypothetical protein